jgi:riboflavin kinase, archaea type
MAYDRRNILIILAQRGGLEHVLDVTTRDLAEWIGTSQQTASIYLSRLASEGFVERSMKRRGSRVRITDKGLSELRGLHQALKCIFGTDRVIVLQGRTVSGLGEGAYYLGQPGYIDQVRERLGFTPFPGTLNIVLGPNDAPILDLLRNGPGIPISEFMAGGRTFGRCLCYRCNVNGSPSAVMIPIRTIHRNTLEVISERKLRDELHLKDGEIVELSIDYPGGSNPTDCSGPGSPAASWL